MIQDEATQVEGMFEAAALKPLVGTSVWDPVTKHIMCFCSDDMGPGPEAHATGPEAEVQSSTSSVCRRNRCFADGRKSGDRSDAEVGGTDRKWVAPIAGEWSSWKWKDLLNWRRSPLNKDLLNHDALGRPCEDHEILNSTTVLGDLRSSTNDLIMTGRT
ncbi:unnamed protein product [Durusdinium trenchii]|uniref:Uncharacterized protein n=1 Tax=Durusdinium trenchii TaxID=1381693 RepID=A0ABP0M615_9DINO